MWMLSSFLINVPLINFLQAIYTDPLGMEGGIAHVSSDVTKTCRFHCGNFGLILLSMENQKHVIEILRKMVQVTMMRGAQVLDICCPCMITFCPFFVLLSPDFPVILGSIVRWRGGVS